jgi:hypothetical protein
MKKYSMKASEIAVQEKEQAAGRYGHIRGINYYSCTVVMLLWCCTLQKLVKKLLTPGTILVGHSLNHALASMLSPLLSALYGLKDSIIKPC